MSVPIILLHGVGLNATIWKEVTAELRVAGHEVDALDLPGHGERPPLTEPATLTEMAQDVLHRMPEEPVHLVGFSLGSLIAQQITLDAPDQVVSLTCVSSVCARNASEQRAVAARMTAAEENFAGSVDRALQRWFPEESSAADSAVRERNRAILLANDVASYLYAYRVFATGDQEIAGQLHRLEVPVLVITGEQDPGSTPEMSRRIAERIGHTSGETAVHIIPGARHMLPTTHSGHLASLISRHTNAS